MSKYNLIDIFEQYRIGSGYTRDFDYAGMLKAGLETGVDTDIEILRKMSDDFEDVNYHRENNHLQKAIDALEEGAIKEASMFFGDFHSEIKSTMETFDMEIPDTLGAFMASKMEEMKEDKYDDIVDADDDIPADKKKEAAAAYRKVDKGASYEKATSHIKEVRIDRDVAERIEGMLSIPLKRKFLDSFMDLWQDLIEEDPFYAEDVINHLNNEMHREIDGYQAMGDKLAGIGESSDEYEYEIGEGAMQKGEADLEAGVKGNMDAFNEGDDCSKHDYKQIDPDGTAECTKCGLRNSDPSKTGEKVRSEGKGVDFIRALKVDANGTSMEIESYLESLKRSGDEFDDVDDYVEDFKNYVADKALQEHFGRFMKDYQ